MENQTIGLTCTNKTTMMIWDYSYRFHYGTRNVIMKVLLTISVGSKLTPTDVVSSPDLPVGIVVSGVAVVKTGGVATADKKRDLNTVCMTVKVNRIMYHLKYFYSK